MLTINLGMVLESRQQEIMYNYMCACKILICLHKAGVVVNTQSPTPVLHVHSTKISAQCFSE